MLAKLLAIKSEERAKKVKEAKEHGYGGTPAPAEADAHTSEYAERYTIGGSGTATGLIFFRDCLAPAGDDKAEPEIERDRRMVA